MKVLIVFIVFSLVKAVCPQSSCTTPNGEEARCIPIKKCQVFLDIFKDGVRPSSSIVDFMQKSTCGFNNGPMVCCGSFNRPKKLTPPNSDPRKHKNLYLLSNNCGLQDVDEIASEENEAQLEEFPWMALLIYKRPKRKRTDFHCGGSLITPQYVLTASHCVIREIPSSVRLGEHDLSSEIDCRKKIEKNKIHELCIEGYQDIAINRIIAHYGYSPRWRILKDDIALIRLARSATMTTNVRPICLPLDGEKSPPEKRMYVAGWGYSENLKDDGEWGSNIKRKAMLPIVSSERCKKVYQNRGANITEEMLCAGGEEGVDTCQGDSGNALVTPIPGSRPPKWYIEGIVSFGAGCGISGIPTVFTRVTSYVNWILDRIE